MSRNRLFGAALAVWAAAASALAADNILSNPGFEDGMPPWAENNWEHNDAQYIRDKANPHSGSYSLQMRFNKAIGGASVCMIYQGVPVQPNKTYKVSYWARGVSNGPALSLMLRNGAPNYNPRYVRFEGIPTEEWQEFSSTVTMPGQVPDGNIQLYFELHSPGVVWIDDVSITEMPDIEGGELPTANPVRNASFEAGRDGWSATFRKREFGTLREESGGSYPAPEDARLNVVDAPDAPQGRRYLTFTLDPDCSRVSVTSAYFPVRYGHAQTIKFSLKADGAKPFHASLASGKNANTRYDGNVQLNATDKWQTFTVPVTPRPGMDGVYCLSFIFEQPGHYSIDAVSVSETGAPPVPLYAAAVALDPEPEAPVANLYTLNQPARLRLRVAAGKDASPYDVVVTDYADREIGRKQATVSLDNDGYGEALVPVPTGAYGCFRVAALQGGNLVAEQIYSVLPPLPPPGERPDSFFGGHVDLTDYNLEIARKAGFRWLRLYPPLLDQWMAVEPQPGVWRFPTDGVAKAKAQGFQLLGNMGTAPDFAADLNPADHELTRWTHSYPPADMDAWKDYVTRVINAYAPYVSTWEVWNEPDGDYMRVKPGVDKADVYYNILKAAREAVDALGKPITLMGPAVANINASLGWKVLDKGGGAFLDAYSFHFYSLAAGGANPDTAYAAALLQKYVTYKNRDGKPMPLWHSEGGIYLSGSKSWLQTYRVPPSSSVLPGEAAASMVRSALFFKASGVKRYFDYQVGASPSGRRVHEDITCGFIDVTGIPSPGIAAHAAMVSLVEDAAPAGFEALANSPVQAKAAHFKGPNGNIDAYWSVDAAPLQAVAGLRPGDEVRDMMGNPVPPAEAKTGQFPLYVLRAR